jgi:hypothetical protein
MSVGFPTAPLASGLMRAGGGAVENPQPVQRFHYLSEIPVQLIPTSAVFAPVSSRFIAGITFSRP